ncbi:NAD-dependent epimerase/dehydratase family protein [bacterium]|nr:NAD-dependent epimerase/dehydratase family protein [bacterium]
MSFFEDKRVVVTGGSGFVGTHFLNELSERGAKIKTHTHINPLRAKGDFEVVESVNLENLEECINLIKGADYVIHSAGSVAHPSQVPTDFSISLNQTILFSNVIEASYKCGVKKFLDINSSTGYPDRRYSITEDEFWDDEPYISYYGYGWMRRYREKIMEHCSHFSDMKIALTRATAVFGPHDNFDLKTCHVVPALIKRVLSGENPLIAWGSPDVVRDFLYVKDVVNGALLVLEKGESMRPYNLGYGSTINIGQIVDTILKVTGKNPKVEWDNTKPTTIPFRSFNTDRIRNELGFKPKYTFEEGIRETIKSYF